VQHVALIAVATVHIGISSSSGMGERRGAYRALVGKSEERRPLERPRRRWEDNIKMDLREVGWGHGLDQSGLG
jgi:hypothetical protein